MNDNSPWVFVSHSSADLRKVRQVRNFMEDRDAAPILFHLRALTDPERFWPLIELEISARTSSYYATAKQRGHRRGVNGNGRR
jgi:hypothetical protein